MSPESQRALIEKTMKKTGYNLRGLQKILWSETGLSYESFKRFYRSESYMPKVLADKMCEICGLKLENMKGCEILPDNWGSVKGGRIGFRSFIRRHPDLANIWRSRGGMVGGGKNSKKIKIPKTGEDLSEFIGIVLGDGTVNKNFIRISGDRRYDTSYFSYISSLTKRLFGVESSISTDRRNNTMYLTICSVKICRFLDKKFSIKAGSKMSNNTKIPDLIMKKRANRIACLRGLVDTDGSVSKSGNCLAIVFSSANPDLLDQVSDSFTYLGIKNSKYDKSLYCKSSYDIKKYFETVGSSSMKHIVRYDKWVKEGKILYLSEVLSFYADYNSSTRLPFRGSVV